MKFDNQGLSGESPAAVPAIGRYTTLGRRRDRTVTAVAPPRWWQPLPFVPLIGLPSTKPPPAPPSPPLPPAALWISPPTLMVVSAPPPPPPPPAAPITRAIPCGVAHGHAKIPDSVTRRSARSLTAYLRSAGDRAARPAAPLLWWFTLALMSSGDRGLDSNRSATGSKGRATLEILHVRRRLLASRRGIGSPVPRTSVGPDAVGWGVRAGPAPVAAVDEHAALIPTGGELADEQHRRAEHVEQLLEEERQRAERLTTPLRRSGIDPEQG